MNEVVLIGRLTRDPELRYLPTSQTANCTFTVACDRELTREKRDELESQGKPTADFIRVVAWGKTAENVANYMTKGSRVAVSGRIQTGSYEAQDGSRRYTTDVVARRVEFMDSRSQSQGYSSQSQGYTNQLQEERGYSQNRSQTPGGYADKKSSGNDFFDDDFIPADDGFDDDRYPF